MISSDTAVCKATGDYPLCGSCKLNLENYPADVRAVVQARDHQREVEPDNQPNCRHWRAHWAVS